MVASVTEFSKTDLADAHLLTFDIDWAPDWMVANIAEMLVDSGVSATWFATHDSPIVRDLLAEPLFEVGIHPNFLPESSQGNDANEIISYLLEVVPEAVTMRTHSLFQNERLLQLMLERHGIRIDCSLHLPAVPGLAPHQIRYSKEGPLLVRVPHFFQDNMHMFNANVWDFSDSQFSKSGLKVYDFHPVHLTLNSADPSSYAKMKAKGPIQGLTQDDVREIKHSGSGAATLFREIVAHLAKRSSFTIRKYVEGLYGTETDSTSEAISA